MFDGKAFGEEMVEIVRGYVGRELEPLRERLAALESELGEIKSNGTRFRGVYQRASSYRRGDQATHRGSLWTALQDAPEGTVPGEDPAAWQLAAKGAA